MMMPAFNNLAALRSLGPNGGASNPGMPMGPVGRPMPYLPVRDPAMPMPGGGGGFGMLPTQGTAMPYQPMPFRNPMQPSPEMSPQFRMPGMMNLQALYGMRPQGY